MAAVIVELSKTFKYSNQAGTEVECSFIELIEPTGKVSNTCCQIESFIQKGLMEMASMFSDDSQSSPDEQSKESKLDKKTILVMMNSSGAMDKIVIKFRDLFKSVALMGGEKALTIPRMDEMSHKDFKELMVVYTENFILN